MKTLIFLAVAAVIGWSGFQFLSAVYENIQIQEHVTELIVQHRYDTSDGPLAEDIFTDISANKSIKIKSRDIDIDRTGSEATVKFSYTKTIEVPLIKKQWVLHFTREVKQKTSF